MGFNLYHAVSGVVNSREEITSVIFNQWFMCLKHFI